MNNAVIKRGIYLTDPSTNEEVCRREYIKKLYVEGSDQHNVPKLNRRAIVNHLRDRFNHIVPFQIVFQATAGCDHFIQPNTEVIEAVKDRVKKALRSSE